MRESRPQEIRISVDKGYQKWYPFTIERSSSTNV